MVIIPSALRGISLPLGALEPPLLPLPPRPGSLPAPACSPGTHVSLSWELRQTFSSCWGLSKPLPWTVVGHELQTLQGTLGVPALLRDPLTRASLQSVPELEAGSGPKGQRASPLNQLLKESPVPLLLRAPQGIPRPWGEHLVLDPIVIDLGCWSRQGI